MSHLCAYTGVINLESSVPIIISLKSYITLKIGLKVCQKDPVWDQNMHYIYWISSR
jgi:hypothetical protein